MLCLKKRRIYSVTQDVCTAIPRQSKSNNNYYERSLNMVVTTVPRKHRTREENSTTMVLTVTEDTPADMLTGSMELLIQLPPNHHLRTQRITVLRSTPMMDLLIQIATAHKLMASNYTLQAIGECGLILPHHPNTPIGALDVLQVKLLPKQTTCVRKIKQVNQPFETTFRLQVHLPRNQLYVSRVSPKMNLGKILDEVCREKNLDRSKYELRHPVNLEEILDLSLSLQDYHLQEVTLYAKQTRNSESISTQDIMALQRQEERYRQQTKESMFDFVFKKSKESSLITDGLRIRSVSPARSDETVRSISPLQPPTRPQRKRRPAPKPPANAAQIIPDISEDNNKDKIMINHSFRKKRVAPLPPIPKPLSSAISTQALERIVDSEESLIFKSSKPSSDIVSSSKASFDIDCLKANSDVDVSTRSTRQSDYKLQPGTVIGDSSESDYDVRQNHMAKANIDTCSKSDLAVHEPAKVITENTLKVEQTKITAERAVHEDIPFPSETDILLQKVSDTFSNVLPTSSISILEPSLPLETSDKNITAVFDGAATKTDSVEMKNEFNESRINFSKENTIANTPDINSQQDISDLSAMDENSSIGSDWQYQLPAPPSAFRDSHSPIFENYDTVLLESVETSIQPVVNPTSELINVTDSNNKNLESIKNISNNSKMNHNQEASNENIDLISETEINNRQTVNETVKQVSVTSQNPEINPNLQKEMILELENKIETSSLAQNINKDFDRRNMDSLSAPELAPVDNTLSNFTITTYIKQKSLDIFEELEESSHAKNLEQKFIKTFATLSRNNANANYGKRNTTKNICLNNNISFNKKMKNKYEEPSTNNTDHKMKPNIQDETSYKWQCFNMANDKTNIQRSKSYISMPNNIKYQKETQGTNVKRHESQIEPEIVSMKKAMSITDLNIDTLKDNERKFSQWRDNILKNEEESTKEKQLQSLQVLKSILPQLKNAQQTEENVSKNYINELSIQKTKYETKFNKQSARTDVLPSCESQNSKSECKQSLKEENTKRYVYTGPPAISLGSWLERPSVNVQIKGDTDYKLGRSNTTIINLNDTKNKKETENFIGNVNMNNIEHEFKIDSLTNNNLDELSTKKLITTSNFKMSNQIHTESDLTKNENRPIVMGVELKKTFIKTPKEILKSDENVVDTTPINLKELTNTFGQYVNFNKQKPKRASINKSSTDHRITQTDDIKGFMNSNIKENSYTRFTKTINHNDLPFKSEFETHNVQQNLRAKRFTSIVDVNGTSQNLESQQEMPLRYNIKKAITVNPLVPVVKGFKLPEDSKTKNNQINHNGLSMVDGFNKNIQFSKSPTMPVITGVMLKNANARSKSISVELDSRDMLLESIRNFGGREKLRSTAERYT
ncbi:hypothetical protein P5V15_009852 [Pogonomyrmex californicus]